MPDLGRIAYEAYGKDAGWKTFNDRRMPPWFDLGPAVQQHWQAAAAAIVRAIHVDLVEAVGGKTVTTAAEPSEPTVYVSTDPAAHVAWRSDNGDEPEEPPKKNSRSQRPIDQE